MRTNSTRQPLILGLLIGILLGAVVVLHGLEILPGGYKYAAFAISVSIFLVALLFLLAIYYRDRIIQKLFGDVDNVDSVLEESQQFTATIAGAVTDLALKGTNLTPEAKERAKAFAPRAASFILWRNVRNWWFRVLVAIIVAIGGLATTILLVNQNKLLETQNEKIEVQNQMVEIQNQKIEVQTSLMEAERRSALVLLMSNILNDVRDEIKEQKVRAEKVSSDSLASLEEKGFALSEPLIGRIAALSQGFLPYRILQGDTLTEKEYSIERGQLLLSLANSILDSITLKSIYKKVVFTNSYLVNANLENAYLCSVDLRHANLHGANLRGANLRHAHLGGAILQGAYFNNASLYDAYLGGTNLIAATFLAADLRKAKFSGDRIRSAYFQKANLQGASFYKTDLRSVDFRNANLKEVTFREAQLSHVNFHSQNLAGVDFSGLDLLGVDFRKANLSMANFNSANLLGADMRSSQLSGTYFYNADLRRAKLENAEGLVENQLFMCHSLNGLKGIDNWEAELEREKPCLFTEEGCPVEEE